jgi:hypothetical protein
MVSKIIQFVIVFALVALLISIFPKVYAWALDFIRWVIGLGKWGVIALITCIVIAFLDGLR